jgi:hypothetical protein
MKVTVHSLGAVDAPRIQGCAARPHGKVIATANAGPLKAPLDLFPKTEEVSLPLRRARTGRAEALPSK